MADHAHLDKETQRSYFREFSRAKNRVAIYGDTKVAKAMSNYYDSLVNSTQGTKLLSREEHEIAQKGILNAIREDLGLEKLANFKITVNRIS